MSKYNAKKTEIDGITFDSKLEAKRYIQLKEMQEKGEIYGLELQKKFELIPAQFEMFPRYSEKTGKRLKDGRRCLERACIYKADFSYYTKDGKMVVEDTKGMMTDKYIIKRKLMLYIHGIKIKEVLKKDIK